MRRWAVVCLIIIIILAVAGLARTAVDPEYYTGEWYSSDDQTIYTFREGLIFSSRDVELLDEATICGAYSYSKAKVFLFAENVSGLETEKMLYLIRHSDSSFLCETEDGSGKIYFVRYSK